MVDAVERLRVAEPVGLAGFLLAGVVALALGTWSVLSVLVGLPDYLVRGAGVVDEVSFGLVLLRGLLGLALAVAVVLGWLYVASVGYGRLEAALGRP